METKVVIFVTFLKCQEKFRFYLKFILLVSWNLHCEGLIPSRSTLFPAAFYSQQGVLSIRVFSLSLGKRKSRRKQRDVWSLHVSPPSSFFSFPHPTPFLFYFIVKNKEFSDNGFRFCLSPIPKGLCYYIICTLSGIHCSSTFFFVLHPLDLP